jgi:hypothetical protein
MTSEEHNRRTVAIPAHIELAVCDAVARHLEAELGDRGLLLTADALAAAAAETATSGSRLLTAVLHRCYPLIRQEPAALTVEFESERSAERLEAALAFGADTARVLAPGRVTPRVKLLCAVFNLGIGLVDSLCDDDAETGQALLDLVQRQDLARAVAERRARAWLRDTVPPALAADPTVAFTVEIIETFFETLHDVYPGDAWARKRDGVGMQLAAALEAERQSVIGWAGETARGRLIAYSRGTSVLPFQIIEALAGGSSGPTERSAGTLLGEALWRIDDLVDLCQDARSGALNGVLLAAAEEPRKRDPVAALERLLASTEIARAATEAAGNLVAGLQRAGDGRTAVRDHPPGRSFLHFIQRYAGIAPAQSS